MRLRFAATAGDFQVSVREERLVEPAGEMTPMSRSVPRIGKMAARSFTWTQTSVTWKAS